MEIIWRVICWWWKGENEGNGTEIKKHNWEEQNRQGVLRIV